jgi:hypothetical protein
MAKRASKPANDPAKPTSRKKATPNPPAAEPRSPAAADTGATAGTTSRARPSALVDTRVVWCGDCLEQLANLPDKCVDLIYIDPPFNSNRNYFSWGEVFCGETKEKRAFEDRHESTQAYIGYVRPRGGSSSATVSGQTMAAGEGFS